MTALPAHRIRRAATRPARRVLRTALGVGPLRRQVVRRLLERPDGRDWLIHQLAVHQTMEQSDFDRASPPWLESIRGFEDCYWLFSSNELNLGLSQLRLDEAAHFYRVLRRLREPRVVELGRYKGGTSFLLAAAGARVLALDNDELPGQERFLPALTRALERHSLAGSVDAVYGDAFRYPVDPESFDLVLVHCAQTTEHGRALFERWWPGVKPGGHLVLHATPLLPGVSAFAATLDREADAWGAHREPNVPGEHVFFRKLR
jgi:SAM-dependent methyltransferase